MANLKLQVKSVKISKKELERIEKLFEEQQNEIKRLSAELDNSSLGTFKVIDALANVFEIDVDRTYQAVKEDNFNRFELKKIESGGNSLVTHLHKEI